MAFEKIEKSARGGGNIVVEPEVRMGYHLGNETNKNRSIYISMTKALVEQLGWPIAKPEGAKRISTTFAVHEGTKEDSGFWMFEYDERGYVLGTTTGKTKVIGPHYSMTTNLAIAKIQHYAVNDPLVEKQVEALDYSIDDGRLLVQLPEWMRYNGPPADPKPAEVTKERQPRPTPVRKIAQEAVNDVAVEFADKLPNRAARRRLASEVARKIAH